MSLIELNIFGKIYEFYSLNGKAYFRKFPQSLKAAGLDVKLIVSFWNSSQIWKRSDHSKSIYRNIATSQHFVVRRRAADWIGILWFYSDWFQYISSYFFNYIDTFLTKATWQYYKHIVNSSAVYTWR